MNPHLRILALAGALLAFAGCGHDMEDCCVTPVAVTFGPAGAPPALGTCTSFAVIAGNGVTCTGPNVTIDGDVGCSPSGNITGCPSGQPTHGNKHENDTVAAAAQSGCAASYTDLVARPINATLSGVDLGGRTFTGGVWCFATSATLTGTLTLDARGNSNTVFVFQVGNDLTCANNSAIVLVNGAQARNVYWQVGHDASLGSGCNFHGTVIALSNVTCHAGSNVHGRALARNGTVSLDDCSVSVP